jgi:NAD(P)-dependent dehydrogenase (short-subunit alcohol dehydrogenase family)
MTVNINEEILKLISLEDKVAMVTGGSSGIGRAAALRLAQAGASLAILDINQSGGRTTVQEIEKIGAEARFYSCDVSSDSDCQKTVELVHQEFGRLDILLNNAGIIWRKAIVETSEDEWDALLDVNLKGVFLLSRRVIPEMVKSGGGSIINTGSGWGLEGGDKAAAYCAAKGGVVNLTRAMAIDYGKDGIRVNCVCPGDIDTEMLNEEAVQLGLSKAEFLKQAEDRPLQRLGRPEDVANAVLYFASDLSSWVTGAMLVVDGGGLA